MSDQSTASQSKASTEVTLPGQPANSKPSEAWLKISKHWASGGGESLAALRATLTSSPK